MPRKTRFRVTTTYQCVQDKIKQTALFNMAGIRTREPGSLWKNPETDHHRFISNFHSLATDRPGIGHGQGLFLIRNRENLEATSTAAAWLTSRLSSP